MRPNDNRPAAKRRNMRKRSGSRSLVAVAVMAISALGVLAAPAIAGARTIKLFGSGSSAAQPYMEVLFSAYHRLHHNVSFSYNPDGGNQGQADVANGRSVFAINTALKPIAGIAVAPLLEDALCIDVNSKNKLSSIAIPTLRSIYTGTTLSWGSVPGSNLSTTIDPQGRNSSAGQYTFFTSAVMNGSSYASNVTALAQDGQVASKVTNDGNAIGYVGLANSHRRGEKSLRISRGGGTAYACNAANVRAKRYPLWRYDYGVINYHHPNAQVLKFFNWVTDTKAAARIINRAGAVSTPKHRFGAKF